MQKLVFEEAWDKTIAPIDRELITKRFEETKEKTNENQEIVFTPIRKAFNHERSLLVTVLIHNFTEREYLLKDWQLTYFEDDEEVASENFSFPHVTVNDKTSMPWTFVFPLKRQKTEPKLQHSTLVIQNYRDLQ